MSEIAAPVAADSQHVELGQRVRTGLKWNAIAQVSQQLSRTIVALALARLLTPDDYGLAGMALVFSGFVLALSDLGLGVGLVQRASITERDRSTVFWTSAAIGILLTVTGLLSAPAVARFYGEPKVAPLLAVLSLSFVITALQTTHAAILQREMNFRAIELRLIGGTVAGGAIGLGAALLGAGAWALVLQQVAATTVSTTLLWMFARWRPRFIFSFASLRDIGSFGLRLFGSRVAELLMGNTDKLVIGRVIGSTGLGVYTVAYNLIALPFSRLIVPVQDTMFPAFARIQSDRKRLTSMWIRASAAVAALIVPAMLGLAVVADDFIYVLLGAKWSGAASVVQVLAAPVVMVAISSLATRVLTALDRPSTVLRFSIGSLVANLLGIAVGVQWGIVGVAAGIAVVSVPTGLTVIYLACRELGISVGRFLRPQVMIFAASTGMVVLVRVVDLALGSRLSPAPTLAVEVSVGVVSYVGLLALASPQVLRDLYDLRKRRTRRDTASSLAA